ncbi:solute carrier family 22 member 7-like [Amblyomma americanum]
MSRSLQMSRSQQVSRSQQKSPAGSPSRTTRPDSTDEEPCWPEEDLSAILGIVGPFHRAMLVYSTFAMTVSAMHTLLYIIVTPADVAHWCRLPDVPANTTLEQWKAMNIPRQPDGSLSGCEVYAAPADSNETLLCPRRSFKASGGKVTTIEEWDLACDRAWLYTAGENVFMLGTFFGLSVSGLSADRVGRKPVVCLSALVLEVAGVSMYSVESLVLFIAFRFLVAASSAALTYTNYVLLVELVALQQRALYGMSVLYGYFAGVLLVNVIVAEAQDWRTAQIIVMLPTTLLLAGFWLLPESPRWLITTLRVRDAVRSVSLILRRNHVPRKRIVRVRERLRQEPLQMLHREDEASPKSPSRRRAKQAHELEESEKHTWALLVIVVTQYQLSTMGLSFCWFACSITFYGIAIDLSAVSGSWPPIVVALTTPLAAYALIVRRGRRDVLAASLAAAGVCCLLVAPLPLQSTVRPVVILGAWFAINLAYAVLFLYATEIYPTTIRALGFNLGAAFGRIGTIMAPFLYENLQERKGWVLMSYVVLSLACGFSGYLVTKLPETKATHLPEKIKPEENIFDFVPMRSPGGRRSDRGRKPETESTAESQRAFRVIMALFRTPGKDYDQHSARGSTLRKHSAATDTVEHLPPGSAVEVGLPEPDVIAEQADPTNLFVDGLSPDAVASGGRTEAVDEAGLEAQHSASLVAPPTPGSLFTKDSANQGTAVEPLRELRPDAEHWVSAAPSPSAVIQDGGHAEAANERLRQAGPGAPPSASPAIQTPVPRSDRSSGRASTTASPKKVARRPHQHRSPKQESPVLAAYRTQLQEVPSGELTPAELTSGGALSALSPEFTDTSPQRESHRTGRSPAPVDHSVASATEGRVSEAMRHRDSSGRRRRKRRPRIRGTLSPPS